MYDREVPNQPRKLQRLQPLLVFVSKLVSRPLNRTGGQRVEITEVCHLARLFVVIAFDNRTFHRTHQLQTCDRVGIVPDQVSQTDVMGDLMGASILQNGLEGLEVGMYVTKNCVAHGAVKGGRAGGLCIAKIFRPRLGLAERRRNQTEKHLSPIRQTL